jgi:hypothetical protein
MELTMFESKKRIRIIALIVAIFTVLASVQALPASASEIFKEATGPNGASPETEAISVHTMWEALWLLIHIGTETIPTF